MVFSLWARFVSFRLFLHHPHNIFLGNIPGRPQGGRHGMVFGQIPVPPTLGGSCPVPLVPGSTPHNIVHFVLKSI